MRPGIRWQREAGLATDRQLRGLRKAVMPGPLRYLFYGREHFMDAKANALRIEHCRCVSCGFEESDVEIRQVEPIVFRCKRCGSGHFNMKGYMSHGNVS
jgi:hypothetical protein